MRPVLGAMVLVLSLAPMAWAQDVHQPSDYKKMYEDASAQLRASQNRKAELAADNAKLTTRVADLQTELQSAHLAMDLFDQRTLLMRAVYAGWESFTRRNPAIYAQWRAFWGLDFRDLPEDSGPVLFDPQWPFTSQ
jgi:hypothetical protein